MKGVHGDGPLLMGRERSGIGVRVTLGPWKPHVPQAGASRPRVTAGTPVSPSPPCLRLRMEMDATWRTYLDPLPPKTGHSLFSPLVASHTRTHARATRAHMQAHAHTRSTQAHAHTRAHAYARAQCARTRAHTAHDKRHAHARTHTHSHCTLTHSLCGGYPAARLPVCCRACIHHQPATTTTPHGLSIHLGSLHLNSPAHTPYPRTRTAPGTLDVEYNTQKCAVYIHCAQYIGVQPVYTHDPQGIIHRAEIRSPGLKNTVRVHH